MKSRAGGDRAGVPAGKMDEEGLIRKTDFMTVLNHPTSIPCLTSTPLYPDWSFAALPAVSDELADRVTRVLFNAPQNATFRWGAPASTREVEALLRDVRQHPSSSVSCGWMSKAGLFNTDWRWGRGHRIAVAYAQLHLGDAVGSPTWQAAGAEQRVVAQTGTGAGDCPPNERAGEMTSGFAHELNQPLSAIRHYAQGCLIRLRGQDEQHPLLPALEHIDARHNEEPIRCAISGSGSAGHRAIRYSPMTGKPSTFTMLSITSGNYCVCPSNSRR